MTVERIDELEAEVRRLRTALQTVRDAVNAQAEDGGLWFFADTMPEAYLQQELRALHSVIEAVANGKGDRDE